MGVRSNPDWRFLDRYGASFAEKPEGFVLPAAYRLCRLDSAGRRRKGGFARERAHRISASPGTYAVAIRPPLKGRLVRIIALDTVVDPSLVAAAIDTDPLLNAPGGAGTIHCHHACDLHHFTRFLHPAESACERWGSLLHQLFDSEQTMPPHRMANR